jgi:hypothetical protein
MAHCQLNYYWSLVEGLNNVRNAGKGTEKMAVNGKRLTTSADVQMPSRSDAEFVLRKIRVGTGASA